jgi:hypothetical protein
MGSAPDATHPKGEMNLGKPGEVPVTNESSIRALFEGEL